MKDRATRIPLKTGDGLRSSDRVSNSSSTTDTGDKSWMNKGLGSVNDVLIKVIAFQSYDIVRT